MAEDRIVEVELLQPDLQEIRSHMAARGQSEEAALADLLMDGLGQFQRDDALWKDLQGRQDPAAQSATQELKRRETLALLISMRSRTVRSEMEMSELGAQVQMLEAAHTEKRDRAERLRQSIASLRRRIAALEDAMEASTPLSAPAGCSLRARLVRLLSRRRG